MNTRGRENKNKKNEVTENTLYLIQLEIILVSFTNRHDGEKQIVFPLDNTDFQHNKDTKNDMDANSS